MVIIFQKKIQNQKKFKSERDFCGSRVARVTFLFLQLFNFFKGSMKPLANIIVCQFIQIVANFSSMIANKKCVNYLTIPRLFMWLLVVELGLPKLRT
jgi:hypothetical protein